MLILYLVIYSSFIVNTWSELARISANVARENANLK